ncbi:Alpha-(1,3)-fucosyltransferase 11 [Holothuria leucospilota]|uniref:Fucosyltransferase n=1 Tax=Holothuria leucospilota TaxID=206669 RepID=A0A9Q0YIE2_HOLLE|nr:Alpha-(1,3)-fucosyltransferase 11 [Holothuria leucospilota]
MGDHVRRRKVDGRVSGDPSASTDSKPQSSSGQRTGNNQNSEELEYLEVKHVVILMVIVFILFFTGAFLFLNAVSSIHPQLNDHEPINSNNDDVHSKKYKLRQSPPEEKSDTLKSNGKKKSEKQKQIKNLNLPTILWWTDMLYPHILSDSPVTQIKCGVGTCYSTDAKEYLGAEMTRGIMFYGTDFRAYEAPLPRQPWHEWALLHEESPMNNYILSHSAMLRLFNHTSTFRRESHFPITTHSLTSLSFLTEREPVPLSVKNKLRKESLAPIVYVQSHCNIASDRDRYVKELMKYIDIDSYGDCLNNKELPSHLQDPVESMFSEEFYDFISNYKFHLAFENAICDDYITEKFFRPFHVGSVPVYLGASTARDWAPNNSSVIMVNSFESPKELAEFIKALDENDEEYEKYLAFKKEGIQNPLLEETMNTRNWAINDFHQHSFITAFECYVCDNIYERWNLEKKQKDDPSVLLPPPSMGQYKHMGCPEPFVPVGKLEDVNLGDDIHTWIQDYWSMHDQALALQRMIREGYGDVSKLFDILHEMYKEKMR